MDWYHNLRIVLSVEDKLPYLEQPIPAMPVPPARQVLPSDFLNTHTTWVNASKEIAGLMLMTMDPDIQKNLEQLGAYDMLKELKTFHAMTQNLSVSLILVSLRKEYDSFVQYYNMHSMGKTMNELHSMLKLHEQTLPPKDVALALHAIRAGRVQKNQKKKSHKAVKGNQGKGKAKMGNALVPTPSFAPNPKNPPTPKKDNPAKDAICHQYGEVGHWRRNCHVYLAELLKKRSYLKELALQGLRGSRKLKLRSLSLYVGDGYRAAVEAIREFHLCLPSGLDDIYEIDLSSSNTNDSSMYAISNKRAKLNLDSTLLWHCRLGHISKKRIEKLQHDGLLDSTDIKSFEKCVSCMSGKMARKPYSHQVERAKDLLGLIYTDHKHEVFETFKVFQKEVENQIGKTIKSLHSDHGGEYMSQEFFDHLKKHGIIAHRTPPYTLQHNSVSERRNRTLLDMIRSMMSQTTLLKSFWDYALESGG
ncbi:retrotransposon protein, putative, ty1-copia subclass [Tanacetum coccineum]